MLGALLASVVTLYAVASYVDLRRVLLEAEGDRLRSSAELVARLTNQTLSARREALVRLAESDPGRRLDSGSLLDTLRARMDAQDQVLRLDVTQGDTCLGSAQRQAPGAPVSVSEGCGPWSGPLPEPGESFSAIHAVRNLAVYTTVVTAAEARVSEQRALASAQGTELIASLIASDADLVIANLDGSAGSNLASLPSDGLVPAGTIGIARGDDGGRIVGGAGLSAAPWGVWLHRDVRNVLAPARSALRSRLLLGLIVILGGCGVAVVLSRRLTVPLGRLASTAEDFGRGRLDRRVPVDREDELGVLAASFNAMAEQVAEQKAELERRVAARTDELNRTVERLRAAQEDLVRAERLATLGHLAGGVGHELRNPLGAMSNAVYCLREAVRDAPAGVERYVDVIERQIQVSLKIISSLLDYARGPRPERRAVDVRTLVEEALERANGGDGVDVVIDLPPDLPPVHVDPDHLGQVVLNLVTNAFQALGGRAGAQLAIGGALVAGDVELVVADNGPGIEPEHLDKVFEPLFTTRTRGIGLGLSLCRSFVQANGGSIQAESEVGAGTRFVLTLPAATGELAGVEKEGSSAVAGPTGD